MFVFMFDSHHLFLSTTIMNMIYQSVISCTGVGCIVFPSYTFTFFTDFVNHLISSYVAYFWKLTTRCPLSAGIFAYATKTLTSHFVSEVIPLLHHFPGSMRHQVDLQIYCHPNTVPLPKVLIDALV